MARYDVYAHPDGQGLLLDVQTDLLDGFNTRVVVPLLPRAAAPTPAQRLNPEVTLDGTVHVMVTQWLAAVPTAELGAPRGHLGADSDRILAALDMVFHGF